MSLFGTVAKVVAKRASQSVKQTAGNVVNSISSLYKGNPLELLSAGSKGSSIGKETLKYLFWANASWLIPLIGILCIIFLVIAGTIERDVVEAKQNKSRIGISEVAKSNNEYQKYEDDSCYPGFEEDSRQYAIPRVLFEQLDVMLFYGNEEAYYTPEGTRLIDVDPSDDINRSHQNSFDIDSYEGEYYTCDREEFMKSAYEELKTNYIDVEVVEETFITHTYYETYDEKSEITIAFWQDSTEVREKALFKSVDTWRGTYRIDYESKEIIGTPPSNPSNGDSYTDSFIYQEIPGSINIDLNYKRFADFLTNKVPFEVAKYDISYAINNIKLMLGEEYISSREIDFGSYLSSLKNVVFGFNSIPEFYQNVDSEGNPVAWAQTQYGAPNLGGGTIGSGGCGPTSLAMILTGLQARSGKLNLEEFDIINKDGIVDPVEACKFADDNGYRAYHLVDGKYVGDGTYAGIFAGAGERVGIPVVSYSYADRALAYEELAKGNPIAVHVGGQDTLPRFTSYGHYMVLAGIDENGLVLINDPNGRNEMPGGISSVPVDFEFIAQQTLTASSSRPFYVFKYN